MPEIVDLRELVPDDIVFVLPGDREYRIPGDIDVDSAFRLLKLLVDLTEAQAAEAAAKRRLERAETDGAVDEIEDAEAELAEALETSGQGAERAGQELRRVLLELLQIRQPDLDRLPFGIVACQHVTGEVLRRIGLIAEETDADEAQTGRDPTRRRPNANGSRTRSSGSTRSSRSSGSTRKA